jgi:hypothetical protein
MGERIIRIEGSGSSDNMKVGRARGPDRPRRPVEAIEEGDVSRDDRVWFGGDEDLDDLEGEEEDDDDLGDLEDDDFGEDDLGDADGWDDEDPDAFDDDEDGFGGDEDDEEGDDDDEEEDQD